MIITPENPKNYCIVCNEVARRKDLSARAKGIYYYLATLPPSWELQQQEAENHFTEGREAFRTAFKELITTGYIKQIRLQDVKGRLTGWKYNVLWSSSVPEMQETDTPENQYWKNRKAVNQLTENPTVLNTDILNTDLSIIELSNQNNSLSENPTDSDLDKWKSEFEIFRKAFTGTKLGLETEFKAFIKKNKDYRKIIPLLLPAIEAENAHRAKAVEIGAFFPVSKSLSVWLNKRCWEQELPALIPKQSYNSEPQKTQLEYQKKGQSYNGLL